MRKPQDKLGQRQLVYELKHAIDRCMRRPWDRAAHERLDTLIDDNPRSFHSTHVLHNIGLSRRRWLTAYLTNTWITDLTMLERARLVRALPTPRDDAASLAKISETK